LSYPTPRPLNYLVQIDLPDLLLHLYGRVLIPPAVWQELDQPEAPASVRDWVRKKPEWIEIKDAAAPPDPGLEGLDPGERAAIQLAEEIRADLLLIDEKLGARLSRQRGLKVIGTLGVLVQAARRGLVDIDNALARLERTSFRHTPSLFEQVRRAARAQSP
jgi:predicted nucleic acid-binding protein